MNSTTTPFWLRHDPLFCISGSVFSQPVLDGLLRAGFGHRECGALDAPNYLPTGSICSTAYPTGYSEDTLIGRDSWAESDAEPDDHAWNCDTYDYSNTHVG